MSNDIDRVRDLPMTMANALSEGRALVSTLHSGRAQDEVIEPGSGDASSLMFRDVESAKHFHTTPPRGPAAAAFHLQYLGSLQAA